MLLTTVLSEHRAPARHDRTQRRPRWWSSWRRTVDDEPVAEPLLGGGKVSTRMSAAALLPGAGGGEQSGSDLDQIGQLGFRRARALGRPSRAEGPAGGRERALAAQHAGVHGHVPLQLVTRLGRILDLAGWRRRPADPPTVPVQDGPHGAGGGGRALAPFDGPPHPPPEDHPI